MLKLQLRIKFRFLFTDIYKIDKTFDVPLGIPIPIPAIKPGKDGVLFDDHGVYLKAWVV